MQGLFANTKRQRVFGFATPLVGMIILLTSPISQAYGWQEQEQEQEEQQKSLSQLMQDANRYLAERKQEQAFAVAKTLAGKFSENGQVLQAAGEIAYLAGFARESLPWFDQANKLRPEFASHNWQRGIALATCGKFAEGAAQFKRHHDVNPDDVENSAWYFLCVAKDQGLKAARETVIPSRGDQRQPMMTILEMLRNNAKTIDVLRVAEAQPEGRGRKLALMYATLYVGLYEDSIGNTKEAKAAFDKCIKIDIDNYMSRTAYVYRSLRFKKSKSEESKSKS